MSKKKKSADVSGIVAGAVGVAIDALTPKAGDAMRDEVTKIAEVVASWVLAELGYKAVQVELMPGAEASAEVVWNAGSTTDSN